MRAQQLNTIIKLWIYVVPSVSFQIFFVQAFKIVLDFENSVSYCYTSYEMTDQFLRFLKPGCHSWWISKMQSDTFDERYTIKFYFKLGKNATEMYGMLQTAFRPSCMNQASIFQCIRHSRKTGSLWGVMRGVGGVSKSIPQSWLAKRLGLGLRCWGFKGVQEEIPSEMASTLQIGSVAFPPGQCTSSQLHPCHRLFDQDGHPDSSSASL